MNKDRWVLWHYIKSYKFNSIFIRNFLIIVLPTILLVLFISTSIYNYYSINIKEEIKTANINGLSKIKNMVDKTLLDCDRLSIWLASDPDIKILMSYKELNIKEFDTFLKYQNLFKIMKVIPATNDFISSAYVYLQNSNFVLSTDENSVDFPHFPDQDWISSYKEQKNNGNYWVIPRKVSKLFREDSLYYLSTFRPISNYSYEGLVIINIDMQKLKQIIDNADDRKEHDLYIMDKEGTIVYSADTTLIGKKLEELEWMKGVSLAAPGSFFTNKINNTDSVVTLQSSDYNQWTYLYIEPVSLYSQRSEDFYRFMMVSVIACLCIVLLISFFISLKVFQPIKNMVSVLENPNEWEGLIKIGDGRHFNEFKYVARNILKSMDRTRQMEEILSERMDLLRKAQSIALQAQINPHFLYNTLETMNWKAMRLTGGENDISNMITSLSQLLRLSLETENNLVTIATEIEHVKLYLDIQSMRYKDRIEVIWDINPSLLSYKIVKLTLQPLIENSIYHGIKPKKGKGIITITGTICEGQIAIELKDDGDGIRREEVERLNMSMKDSYIQEGYHIGMRNVNQRIKLFFGEEYGLIVKSEYKKYTAVSITIPVVQ